MPRYGELIDILHKKIPREEVKRVFSSKNCEYETGFLGFIEEYFDMSKKVPKDFTIIDFGCAGAPQCYFFDEHKKYIGIDFDEEETRFKCANTEHFVCNGIDWINEHPDFDEKTFAICNYVPSTKLNKMIAEKFPNHFVYYPKGFKSFSLNTPRVKKMFHGTF